MDLPVLLPSPHLSLSPPLPSTPSITPPPSYNHHKERRRSHRQKLSCSSYKEDRPPCQRCLPHSQETRDRLASLTKVSSMKQALQDFHYLVMRDGVQEAVEAMWWILLELGIELEHNVLGCSYCKVVDGQFVYCPRSVYHTRHVLFLVCKSTCDFFHSFMSRISIVICLI